MFEKWNGGNASRSHTYSDSFGNYSSRHKFLEIDVNEVKPSDIVKSVLAKKSIFDDDLKRLENIGEKYEPKDFANLSRPNSSSNSNSAPTTIVCKSTLITIANSLPKLQTMSAIPAAVTAPALAATSSSSIFSPQINQIHPRLNAVSPMNSPQPMSPYNSPSPSPIVVTPNMTGAKMTNCIASVVMPPLPPTPPVKAILQYPFPSHPPATGTAIPSTPTTPNEAPPTPSGPCISAPPPLPTTQAPPIPDEPTTKPKPMVKSFSCQEKSKSHNHSSSGSNRAYSKSVSVPGSTHYGSVKSLTPKDEPNNEIAIDNAKLMRRASNDNGTRSRRDEKMAKKIEALDRRKMESISSDGSEVSSIAEHSSSTTMTKEHSGDDADVAGALKRKESNRDSSRSTTTTTKYEKMHSDEHSGGGGGSSSNSGSAKPTKILYGEENNRGGSDGKWKLNDYDKYNKQHRSGEDERTNHVSAYQQSYAKMNHERDGRDNSSAPPSATNHYSLKSDKHNKENSRKSSRESTPLERHLYGSEEAGGAVKMSSGRHNNSRCNSPNKLNTKRRLSSPQEPIESGEDGKRFKLNAENLKLFDRRDFKDPNSHAAEKMSKYHHRHYSSGSNATITIGVANVTGGKSNNLDGKSGDDALCDGDQDRSHGDERRKNRDAAERHRRSDKLHKSRSKNSDNPSLNSEMVAFIHQHQHQHDMHNFSDDDAKPKSDGGKEKRANLFDQHHQGAYRHHGNDSKGSKSDKRSDRLNSSERRQQQRGGGGGGGDDGHNSSSKSSSERRRQQRKQQNLNSSDDTDSDEPKKHSIFDIPDDGPAYISMYDKVKARSCKNMQKQEEEKKIKEKFSQLKQCRAKREGKKRNSWDEDSDSGDSHERRHKQHQRSGSSKSKHFMNTSSDDDDDDDNERRHQQQQQQRRRRSLHKDLLSDSGSEPRQSSYHRKRLNELCDGESSDNSSINPSNMMRRRITSRKNSRSTRITSETSDDACEPTTNAIKKETTSPPLPALPTASCELKTESDFSDARKLVSDVKMETLKEEKPPSFHIKVESVEDMYEFRSQTPERVCDLSDAESITPSSKTSDTKEQPPIFETLFSLDAQKKKHKKNKKRQRSLPTPPIIVDDDTKPHVKVEDAIKLEKDKINPLEIVFDELKRDTVSAVVNSVAAPVPANVAAVEKKRHSSKKEKKRGKDEHDQRTKDEKYRMKKLKKQSRLSSGDNSMFESQESFSSMKRGEKMEDIFGPLSDDDSHISNASTANKGQPMNLSPPAVSSSTIAATAQPSLSASSTVTSAPKDFKQSSSTTRRYPDEIQPMAVHSPDDSHLDTKWASSGYRQELASPVKRKSSFSGVPQSVSSKDDDNSVDLDAAGRALEAQLMEDSQSKPDELSGDTKTTESIADVFNFSDGDDGVDNVFGPDRKFENLETHRTKEKKKKKKRSRDKKRHHHHSSHSSILSIDIPSTAGFGGEKASESPSLPSLTADNSSTDVIEAAPTKLAADHTQSAPKHSAAKDPKTLIPGFSVVIDESIHASAVQSISSDFAATTAVEPKPEPVVVVKATPEIAKIDEKLEEKSRVIISQEETEDAVAALLGESFGNAVDDYDECFEADPIVEEEEINAPIVSDTVILEEEAEEMRKAVQSLNTDDLDLKPDTPQSENDLQIDTDTEDVDDDTVRPIATTMTTTTLSHLSAAVTTTTPTPIIETKPSPASSVITKGATISTPSIETLKTLPLPQPPLATTTSNASVIKLPNVADSVKLPKSIQAASKPPPQPPIITNVSLQSTLATAKPTYQYTVAPHNSTVANLMSSPSTIVSAAATSIASTTNPILSRSTVMPLRRQSICISPAKTSLSHVVIQQRQMISPTLIKTADSTPTSRSNAPPVLTQAINKPLQSLGGAASQTKSRSTPSAVTTAATAAVTAAPPPSMQSVVNIQMPQTSKQIVLPPTHKSSPAEAKPKIEPLVVGGSEKVRPTTTTTTTTTAAPALTTLTIQPPSMYHHLKGPPHHVNAKLPNSTERVNEMKEFNAPKKTEVTLEGRKTAESAVEKSSENISVIRTGLSMPSITNFSSTVNTEPASLSAPPKRDEAIAAKNETQFWASKDVQNESVIKKMESIQPSQSKDGPKELPKLDDDVSLPQKEVTKGGEVDTPIDGNKVDIKKKEKITRGRKQPPLEIIPPAPASQPQIVEPTKGVINNVLVNEAAAGVQTRRGTRRETRARRVPVDNHATSIQGQEPKWLPAGQRTGSGWHSSDRLDAAGVVVVPPPPTTTQTPQLPPVTSAPVDAVSISGIDNKSRNPKSESDIYEFHEDSGEEAPDGRPRLVMATKPQTASPLAATSNVTPAPTPVHIEPTSSKAMPSLPQSIELSENKTLDASADSANDGKDDPAMNAAAAAAAAAAANNINLRKSRRLIERDGTRSTVDDIIEDVIKNMATESSSTPAVTVSIVPPPPKSTATVMPASIQMQTPTVLPQQLPLPQPLPQQHLHQPTPINSAQTRRSDGFQSGAVATITTATTDIQPRRTTRSQGGAVKIPTPLEKIDVRKSPRPNRNAIAKDRKISDNETTPDDSDAKPREDTETKKSEFKDQPLAAPPVAKMEIVLGTHAPHDTPSKPDEPTTKIYIETAAPVPPPSSRIVEVATNKVSVIDKRSSEPPMALIDPVTGELTVVQQSKEGQYLPVANAPPKTNASPIELIKTTTTKAPSPLNIEVKLPLSSAMTIVPNTSSAVSSPSVLHMQKPSISITTCSPAAAASVRPTTFVVSSQQPSNKIELMSQQQHPQQQHQQQHSVQARGHSLKAHVLNSHISKVNIQPPSQQMPLMPQQHQQHQQHHPQQPQMQPMASKASSPVILTTTSVGPPPLHQQMPQKIQVSMQHQPPPIQMPLAAHMQSMPKSALVVNIPSSSPHLMPSTQSPRLVQATPTTIKHLHQQQMQPMEQPSPQISISASTVHKQHGPPMHHPQPPVGVHASKMHAQLQLQPSVSGNYSSIVHTGGKGSIQSPSLPASVQQHHIKTIQSTGLEHRQSPSAHANQAMLVQMSAAQQVQMQHMPQSQNIIQSKSSIGGHPLNMQSPGQPSPPTFVQHLPQMQPFPAAKVSQSRAHQSMTLQPQPIITAQHLIPAPPQSHGQASGKQQLAQQQQQQIMTGAVASPPPKQPHLNSQQPIVTGNLHGRPVDESK